MQRYFYAVALQGMMQGGEAVTVIERVERRPDFTIAPRS